MVQRLLPSLCLLLAAPCCAADSFAAKGAKATLSVEYDYRSVGSRHSEGQYAPYAWTARHQAQLSSVLVAQPPQPLPSMHPAEQAQTAGLAAKGQQAQVVANRMAPTMASMEKMIAKCGDDEACITREVQKLGGEMQSNGQLNALQQSRGDIDALVKQDAARYQQFMGPLGSGSYSISETATISVTDPICASHPKARCSRKETREGAGKLPAALPGVPAVKPGASVGAVAVEWDSQKNTLALLLPVPGLLPYTELIVTDEPEGTHSTPTPKGPQQRLLNFRVSASGSATPTTLIVPLKGGWRSQAGEQTVQLKGDFASEGRLTVRWRFSAQ